MGAGRTNAEGDGGVIPQSGPADNRNDGSEGEGHRVGVTPGVLCDVKREDAGDKGIHPDVAGHHSPDDHRGT